MDFQFLGSVSEKAQLIGNAVPPLLPQRIVESLQEDLASMRHTRGSSALLSFVPTLANGMSPALEEVTRRVITTIHERSETERAAIMGLTKAHATIWQKARLLRNGAQAIDLTEECRAYLVGRIVQDLELGNQFSEFSQTLASFVSSEPLKNLVVANIDAKTLFEPLATSQANADTYFACLPPTEPPFADRRPLTIRGDLRSAEAAGSGDPRRA